MNKNLNLRMILYELRNINGNFMPHFFGIIFPILQDKKPRRSPLRLRFFSYNLEEISCAI